MGYDKAAFGKRLKELRESCGMSPSDLSEKAGIDYSAVIKYEAGKNSPGLDNAYALAMALGCRIDDLCDLPAPANR